MKLLDFNNVYCAPYYAYCVIDLIIEFKNCHGLERFEGVNRNN